jgi:DNA-binding transcriptional ArsR family regulator
MRYNCTTQVGQMTELKITDEWELINKLTGEIRPLITFEDCGKHERWDKVYARSLADVLNLVGDEKTKILAYLLRHMDHQNRVIETIRSISTATGISKTTVNKTLQILQDNDYLHKVRNGVWRFSPHVIMRGNKQFGAAVIRSWIKESDDE